MDGGLFQILFIAVIILASIFDAVGRSRKRRAPRPEPADEDIGRPEPWEADGREETREEAREEARETADSMVPADLWSILTGERPVPPPEAEEAPEDWSWEGTRREKPAKEEPSRGIPQPYTQTAPRPRSVPQPYARTEPQPYSGTPPRPRAGTAPEDVVDLATLPWRPERRIPEPRSKPASTPSVPGVRRAPPIRRTRSRRRPAGSYTRLLSAGRSGLREAIVLSEILGAPVGLRPGIEPWEER